MRIGLGLLLAGCAAQPPGNALLATAAGRPSGMARLWVFRPPAGSSETAMPSDPMLFVNGAPVARSTPGTLFFHDLQPGTCRLSLAARGAPPSLAETLQLAPGMEVYLQVRAQPDAAAGTAAGAGNFGALAMSAAEAKPYLAGLTELGER